MEVVMPVQELHFNGKTRSAYMSSSSSSPKRFSGHRSAALKSSATTVAVAVAVAGGGSCSLPAPIMEDEDDDFAFDFSSHVNKNAPLPQLTTADELFYQGKIRAVKFPVGLCSPESTHRIGAKSSDPFSTAMAEPTRGRNRAPSLSSRSRKGSRSLSPLRNETLNLNNPSQTVCKTEEESNIISKKWCFKDLLLFRSASEGRATGDRNKDALRKYTAACLLSKGKNGSVGSDESKSSSFRWASPHAIHYAANRAAAEELKKKTALPYKDSFFNWMRYAPALRSFGGSAGRVKNMGGSKSMPRLRDGN